MVLQDLKRLGTDARNQLFWDGKLVRTRLTLTLPQTVVAVLAALASIATMLTGLNNASIYLCGRGISLLGCPAPALSTTPGNSPAPLGSVPAVK